MAHVRPKRIYSTLDGEPELEEPIESFVVTLAERVDELQDAQVQGDLQRLAKEAGALREDALRLGYPQLSEASNGVVEACLAEEEERALEQLVLLTEIARSVRLGHRGAF